VVNFRYGFLDHVLFSVLLSAVTQGVPISMHQLLLTSERGLGHSAKRGKRTALLSPERHVFADGRHRPTHISEADVADACGEVDTDVAAHAHWLQHHLVAADQCIGARAEACGDIGRKVDIVAGQGSRPLVRPGDNTAQTITPPALKANINANLVDSAGVVFGREAVWRIDAVERPARADDVAKAALSAHFRRVEAESEVRLTLEPPNTRS
jgi:hypothetical protein